MRATSATKAGERARSRERSERSRKRPEPMTNTGRTSGGNWTGRAVLVIVLWVVLAGGAYLTYSLVAGRGNDKSCSDSHRQRRRAGRDSRRRKQPTA